MFFFRRNSFESLERQDKRVATVCLFIVGFSQRRKTVTTHHALFTRSRVVKWSQGTESQTVWDRTFEGRSGTVPDRLYQSRDFEPWTVPDGPRQSKTVPNGHSWVGMLGPHPGTVNGRRLNFVGCWQDGS